ncbi:hypothetical protein [Bacillus sp. TH13]|uniref:hypothetical protein n=1 Tax=Bacillus sp. TH13 TaxID=2796379 RepID=UPI001F5BDC0D|nr:hypothetical protein [Bacillus sp. TH13]
MAANRWLTDEERAIAKENGINYQTLYRRVYELGWGGGVYLCIWKFRVLSCRTSKMG